MFADPISVKIADTARDHARIRVADGIGVFYAEHTDSGKLRKQTVTVKQNTTKQRFRREFRISRDQDYTDLNGTVSVAGASVYIVVDEPRAGFEDSELNDMIHSLAAFLASGTFTGEANAFILVSGQS